MRRMLQDTDLAFASAAPLEGNINAALANSGFKEQLYGDFKPPVAHYTLGEESEGFYAEFLTPPVGSGMTIDGNKLKAVNSRDRNFTSTNVDKRVEQIELSIQRYLEALETADRTQPVELQAKSERLGEKIERLRERVRQLGRIKDKLQAQDAVRKVRSTVRRPCSRIRPRQQLRQDAAGFRA